MSELKFYKLAALGLLVLNLGILAFFFLTNPPARLHPAFFIEEAIRILQLDQQQEATFRGLASEHGEEMRRIRALQAEELRPYFNTLIDDNLLAEQELILAVVEAMEGEKLMKTYHHFQKIKTLLRADQLPHFEQFMQQAIEKVLYDGKKPPGAPQD